MCKLRNGRSFDHSIDDCIKQIYGKLFDVMVVQWLALLTNREKVLCLIGSWSYIFSLPPPIIRRHTSLIRW